MKKKEKEKKTNVNGKVGTSKTWTKTLKNKDPKKPGKQLDTEKLF